MAENKKKRTREAHHGAPGPPMSPPGAYRNFRGDDWQVPPNWVPDAHGGWGPTTPNQQKKRRHIDPSSSSSSSSSTVSFTPQPPLRSSSPPPPPPPDDSSEDHSTITFRPIFHQQALDGLVQDIKMEVVEHPTRNLIQFLHAMRATLEQMIQQAIDQNKGITFWVAVHLKYTHPHKELLKMDPPYLNSGRLILVDPSGIQDKLDEIHRLMLDKNANFVRQSSGLVLDDILDFRFKVCEFNPLARSYLPLPKFLRNKGAIVNIQNTDNRCFGYSIIAAMQEVEENAQRPIQYEHLFAQYELDEIDYPVGIADIPAIEDSLEVRINVFSFFDDEGRARFPMYVSKKPHAKCIDLLYWEEHYAWIRSFDRFMADMGKKNRLFWCKACLGHFWAEHSLTVHQLHCRGIERSGQIFITPEAWWKVTFSNQAYVPRPHLPISSLDFHFFLLLMFLYSFLHSFFLGSRIARPSQSTQTSRLSFDRQGRPMQHEGIKPSTTNSKSPVRLGGGPSASSPNSTNPFNSMLGKTVWMSSWKKCESMQTMQSNSYGIRLAWS